MSWFRRITQTPTDLRRIGQTPADVERVKSEIARLDETLQRYDERSKQLEDALAAKPDGNADLTARIDAVAEQLNALEVRLTSVATELANQLSELGNDIESLHNRPTGDPLDEETVGEIRDAQARLANEQARYQIAFRADLARLAEQLRRPSDDSRRQA